MTKHEAVEILKEVKTLDDSMFAYSRAYNDALEMAIEALKSQVPRVMTREEVPTIDAIPIEWLEGSLLSTGDDVDKVAFVRIMRKWQQEQEGQDRKRDYEAAVEMAEYCERYEPTYNADNGSM